MNKLRRIGLRLGAAVLAAVAVAFAVCLDGVDYQPYFRTPYYAATAARLEAARTNRLLEAGELEAGFGRARLTPGVPALADDVSKGQFRSLPLAGYGDRRGRPATGVHDDLFVKAIALRAGRTTVVLVGMDALIVPREVALAACAELERDPHLRREQIYLSATHTHCSLGGWGEGVVGEAFAGPYQPAARQWMAACIVTAVRNAVADLRPAAVGQGSLACAEFVRNRLVGNLGRVDPEFSYLVVRQASGTTAVLGSFAAHATVLSGRVMEFSADYPGAWQRGVEKATGGLAVFLAGGVGSSSPVPGAGGFDGVERMGSALAQRVLERLPQTPVTNQVLLGALGLEVALPPLHLRVADHVRLRPWLAARLLPVGNTTFLQGVRLNDTVWLSTPCDFSAELALGIKDSLRARGLRAVITSFNGDYIGYIIPSRYYHMSGYEPRVMSFFGPNISDYLDEFVRRLARALTQS